VTPRSNVAEPRLISIVTAVALGGAVGAVLRWAVGRTTIAVLDAEPLATLIVNVVGCFLLGLLVARVLAGGVSWSLARPLLGTGVLGGFTTFSAYTADALLLTREGEPLIAGAYVFGTLALCLAAVWIGGQLGQLGQRETRS
jgi:fluoride exporter